MLDQEHFSWLLNWENIFQFSFLEIGDTEVVLWLVRVYVASLLVSCQHSSLILFIYLSFWGTDKKKSLRGLRSFIQLYWNQTHWAELTKWNQSYYSISRFLCRGIYKSWEPTHARTIGLHQSSLNTEITYQKLQHKSNKGSIIAVAFSALSIPPPSPSTPPPPLSVSLPLFLSLSPVPGCL